MKATSPFRRNLPWAAVAALCTLTLALPALGRTDEAREKRKLEYLSRPAFQVNRQVREARQDDTTIETPRVPQSTETGESTTGQTGGCGTHPYLGSYCFRKDPGAQEWTLCTDKWGGCTTRGEGRAK